VVYPIGAHQGIAHPLAEAHIAVELSRLATIRSAELFDAGRSAGEAANIAKFAASEAALKALDRPSRPMAETAWHTNTAFRAVVHHPPDAHRPVSREMVLNFVAQTSLGFRGRTRSSET